MPINIEVDKLDLCILKTIITNKKYALEFTQECTEKLFMPDLWRFVRLVLDYTKAYKEVITPRILQELSKKNKTLDEYVKVVLAKLDVVVYDDKEFKFDLEKLKKRYKENLISDLKNSLNTGIDISKNTGELKSVIGNIQNIDRAKAYKQGSLKEGIDEFRNRYIAKLKDPSFGAGLLTGYSFLDFTLGGLRTSEFFLVASATGGLKSTFLLNTGINMFLNGNNIDMEKDFKPGNDILYFSLEMNYDDIFDRLLSRLAMVPQKSIRDAKLTDDEGKRLSKALRFLKSYPNNFEIVDIPRGATINSIENIYNDIISKRGKPKVVVIDYLGLMSSGGPEDAPDWISQLKVSNEVHEFCRANNIVLLSASQLSDPSGGGKQSQDAMSLSKISRSKGIAFNADFVLFIEKRPQEQNFNDLNLALLKSRRSELASGKLFKNLACCALLDNPLDLIKNDPNDISVDIENILKG